MTEDNTKIAAFLISMGGPENLAGVRPFLYRLFSDRHVIDIPQPGRFLLAEMISTVRAPKVKKRYQQIGGGSPLKKWTDIQAQNTETYIKKYFPNFRVETAFSYIKPSVDEKIRDFVSRGFERIVAVPLYPYYSISTVGSINAEIENARAKHGLGDRLTICPPFYKDQRYINLTAELLRRAQTRIEINKPYKIVFSAHSIPKSFLEKGDPYKSQVEKSVNLIACQAGIPDYILSFQSKVGPVEWIGPSTVETIRKIGSDGIKQVIAMPLGFMCDNIETLHELDIELKGIAYRSGIERFIRGDVFNDNEQFAEFLAEYIKAII